MNHVQDTFDNEYLMIRGCDGPDADKLHAEVLKPRAETNESASETTPPFETA